MRYQAIATAEDGAEAGLLQETEDGGPDEFENGSSFICFWILTAFIFLLVIITFPISGWFVLKKVSSQERFVVFRLGKVIGSKGPGIILLLPFIDQWQVVDIRTKSFTVGLFEAACKDGAQIIVGAEVSYHVSNPVLSVMVMLDYKNTLGHTVQSVMISFLLKKTLDDIKKKKKSKFEEQLSVRTSFILNNYFDLPIEHRCQCQLEINEKTSSWGVQVDQMNVIVHSVLNYPQEDVSNMPNIPSRDQRNWFPLPLQKIAQHAVHSSSSQSTPSQQLSECSSDSEESVQNLNKTSGFEKPEGDQVSPDWVLSRVQNLLSEELVKQIRACYLFIVNQKNGTQNLYHLDLSRDSGHAGYGIPEKEPDVTLEVTENTIQSLFTGALKPLSAYLSGRIRIQGDLKVAMKLEDLIKKLQR
ncbi:stomatin-like protein 1 isoform X3 [Narcine bancroftii]|uniref:stomatin-like protein 1 isoform X3 n=1 Tax=Narcine bancroftii TaxID=1343680 RepID=UPI003831646A